MQSAYLTLQELNELNPESVQLLTGIGLLTCRSGYINAHFNYNPEALVKAQEFYSLAKEANPEFFDAWYFSALAYVYSGELEKAEIMLRTAEKLDPDSHRITLGKGQIAYRSKDY